MDRRNLRAVLRHAAAVAGREPDVADRDLLRRFAQDRDEVAFAELVRRYGRLVWAVCRHLLPADADAEDAFQATFLALVRSAGSVKDGAKLGPWLHGVAVRVCSNARRAASRRKRRELSAGGAEAGRAVPDSAWDSALSAVHEEVARLPETLRVPFVLCCLEGKGVTEAAAQLGWKLGTLSGRLTRAKQALLARLEARGLSAATVAAIAVAGGSASAGVPTVMLDRAVDLIQPGFTVPSSILHLSQGVVGMTVHRTKLLAAAVLLTGGLASVVGTGYLAEAGAQQPKKSDPAARQADDARKELDAVKRALAALQAQTDDVDLQRKQAVEALRAQAEAAAKLQGRKSGSASKWEYDFVLASEMGTTKFVGFLTDREVKGWEFVSQVTLLHDGKDAPHWVFRRPTGGAKIADAAGETYKQALEQFYSQRKTAPAADQEKLRYLEFLKAVEAQKAADPTAKPAPGDPQAKLSLLKMAQDKAKVEAEAARADAVKGKKYSDAAGEKEKGLQAEIDRLRQEIEKLKGGDKAKPQADKAKALAEDMKKLMERNNKYLTDKGKPPGEKTGGEKSAVIKLGGSKLFEAEELCELLHTAAVKQFGKDAAPAFDFDAKAGTLTVRGSAKAVEWVAALASKLNKE